MNTSLLFSKPIKKMPEVLIYKVPERGLFRMIKTKSPARQVGYMSVRDCFRRKNKFLEIDFLVVNPQKKGYGAKFINFAKEICKEGYDGILLQADRTLYNTKDAAHTFYRKHGFFSKNLFQNLKLDFYNLIGKPFPARRAGALQMFFAPNKNLFEKMFL